MPSNPDRTASLFERFRRSGDAEALAAVFEATAPGLLRLAVQLCDDPAQAEDALQSTFVTAMEKAAQYDASRPLEPWLAGILQLHCKALRAKARRSPEPTRLPQPHAIDPFDAAAAGEVRRELREAIDALPAEYRSVVVLRLLHGLQPAAIAHALGEAPGTIRVRLHRGLSRLRQRLPRGLAAPALAWPALRVSAERGLDAVGRAVLSRVAAPSTCASTAALVTVITMKKLVLASVAALAVCAVITASFLRSGEETPPARGDAPGDGTESHLASTSLPHEAAALVGARSDPTDATRLALEPSADPSERGIRVVVSRPDGKPAPRIGITVLPHDGRHPDLHALRRFTDREGVALFADLAPGRYGVYVDRAAHEPRPKPSADAESDATGSDQSAIQAAIRLVDAQMVGSGSFAYLGLAEPQRFTIDLQTPRTSWQAVSARPLLLSGLQTVLETVDPETGDVIVHGGPSLRAVPDCKLSSALPERSALAVVDVKDVYVLVNAELDVGLAVNGRVEDANGAPVADAEVWVVRDGGRTAFAVASSAADGSFRTDELEPGSALFARASGYTSSRSVALAAENATALTLQLGERAAEISGTIVDVEGRPIAEARVRVGDPDEDDSRRVQAQSDADGGFRVPAPARGRVAVLVLASGYQPWLGEAEVRETASTPLVITLQRGAIVAGTVLGPDGQPREGVLVRARAEELPATDVRSGALGVFRLECVAPGPFLIEVDEEHDHRGARVPAVGVLGVEQSVEVRLGRFGRLSGRVLDASGQALVRARVLAIPIGDPKAGPIDARSGDDGGFELRTHPELRYRLEVAPEPSEDFAFTVMRIGDDSFSLSLAPPSGEAAVAGRRRVRCDWLGELPADRENLELRLPFDCVPSAHLSARLLDPEAKVLAASVVIHVDGGSRSVRPDEDGRLAIGPLVPGEYRFEVRPDDAAFAPFDLPVTALAAGQQAALGDVYAKRN
ncbi:MAG: sigma-70 family RNA polymerase sigma factor [Planctomycetes bacterium]|nr:sigma-70 family RNA polymerase sigma factor [Planctomycetota bacterium]